MSREPALAPIPLVRSRGRCRLCAALGASAAAHGLILAWLLAWPESPEAMRAPVAVRVALSAWPSAPPAPAREPATLAAMAVPARRGAPERAARAAAPDTPAPAAAPMAEDPAAPAGPAALGEGDLADAQIAGTGGGADGCGMAARLQAAIRSDPLARAAVAGLGGRSLMVWNGDWTWVTGAEGKGLPAVRQALMWEIAFAPAACRGEAVRGLVVLSVQAPAGPVRLALGAPRWRWSDLLTPRRP